VHLTFQEYFTACAFHDGRDGEALLAHVDDPWWRESIRLYAGLERDASALLERLRHHDLFLAAGCLADCRAVDTLAFRHAAEAIVSDLQHLIRSSNVSKRQDAADALAEITAWGATQFLTEAVAQDATDPALALAATLALTRAADKADLDQLFANLGRTLRLLHGQLFLAGHLSLLDRILHPFHGPPVSAGRSLRERILSLLDWLDHPLVFVPAGEVLMGSNGGKADERPPHKVTLREYRIDKFPVTNEQFAQFVRETGYQAQGNWRSAFKPGKEKHPGVNVTWDDARAYGQWCGKQLPTEAQWEKAARGTDGREYPWGNQWDGNKCNASGHGTTPVEAHTGVMVWQAMSGGGARTGTTMPTIRTVLLATYKGRGRARLG
jgi:sulfatase-modifying factor enzyme 1